MKHRDRVILILSSVGLVWFETWVQWPHLLLGVRLDLLGALVLYCALFRGWKELLLVCVVGGLFFDSFSLNPLGTTVLSLVLPSYLLYCYRRVILHDSPWVQGLLGLGIGIISPFLTYLVLTGVVVPPIIGWSVLWSFFVLGMTTAMATPVVVFVMERLLSTRSVTPQRKIRKGRQLPIGGEV